MSVNTPASWSVHALRTRLGMPFWAGSLARVNTFKCFTHIGHREGEPAVFGSGPFRGTILSSKCAKKMFNLSGSKMSMSATGLVFLL